MTHVNLSLTLTYLWLIHISVFDDVMSVTGRKLFCEASHDRIVFSHMQRERFHFIKLSRWPFDLSCPAIRVYVRHIYAKLVLTNLTHCGRVTQICVFNTVKLGTSASSP